MSNKTIDITQMNAGQTLLIRPESDAECAARLAREEREHNLRLEKERVTFYCAGALYVVCLVVSFGLAVCSAAPDVQKWAMSVTTLLAGGLAGFFTGKATK